MSGSGESTGYGGQFGGDDFSTACDRLSFSTQLSSPQEEVVRTLRVDQELDITLRNQGAQAVVVVSAGPEVAGGIASPQTQRLRECIQQGTSYSATIQSINGGQVRIYVHPVRV